MLSHVKDKAGALVIWSLAVLVLGLTAMVRVAPDAQSQTTLERGLGLAVETRTLRL